MKGGPPGAPDTPSSVEQSPRGMKRGMKQGPAAQRRKKQPPKPITPTGPMPPGMIPQVQVLKDCILYCICICVMMAIDRT